MDVLTRLKASKESSKQSNIPEIQNLQESDIIQIVNRGFTELYRVRPANPIKFLSKWLLKESKSLELLGKYKEDDLKKEKLNIKYYQQEKIKDTENQLHLEEAKVMKDKKTKLLNDIEICDEYWENFSDFCEQLKNIVNATGVYMGIYDLKRKQVTEDDDEIGHIHPSNTKVIRYIAWCKDHDFLHGQCLEPNQGVTFNLLEQKPPQAENQPQNEGENPPQENAGQQDKKEEKKVEEFQTLLIDDVVLEPKIKFFREPRLGSYFAVDIPYNSSLSYSSLLSAIEATKAFNENKAQQEERYKEWSDNNDAVLKEIEDAKRVFLEQKNKATEGNKESNENQNGNNKEEKVEKKEEEKKEDNIPEEEWPQEILDLKNKLVEWKEEPVQLQEYAKEEKKIILCLDTIGQDRVFTEDEMNFVKLVSHQIKVSLESHEKKLLEKDRDIRINFDNKENEIKSLETFLDDKYELLQEKAMTDYFNSEDFKNKNITDENLKALEGEVVRTKYLKNLVFGENILNILNEFDKFEFVEYEKIFQNIFYFTHSDPLKINEPETNKLEWKRARSLWKSVFPYIDSYEPRGPKPEQVKNIYKLNKIKDNLEAFVSKKEDVKKYSFCLYLLVDYILQIIKIRYDDIVQRTNEVKQKKEEREKIIAANNEIEEEKKKYIEQLKAAIPVDANANPNPNPNANAAQADPNAKPQDEEALNNQLKEEIAKFDAEHPKAEVPPEIEFDLDLDYDIK